MRQVKVMIDFERITTRGGDSGESSLYNGERRWKDDLVFEVMGEVDELNSYLGLLRAKLTETAGGRKRGAGRAMPPVSKRGRRRAKIAGNIEEIQKEFINIGAMLATPHHDKRYTEITELDEKALELLEKMEKELMEQVESKEVFIIPGGNEVSAQADIARSVCRRAERRLVTYIRSGEFEHLAICLRFINRLSDYLFAAARVLEESE